MTSSATPALDETMDVVKKKEDEKTHNEEASSQPQPQEFDIFRFEDYLFLPPPTPSQTNKPSNKRGRPRHPECVPASRDYILPFAPAEVEDLDYQPLPVANLEHGTFHRDADPNFAPRSSASTVPEKRSRKRAKAEFNVVEAELDHCDDHLVRNGGAWSLNGELNCNISESLRLDAEVFNHKLSSDMGGGILGTEALLTNRDGFEPELEEVERLSFPGIQEFGITRSREDDFNSAWFRNGHGHAHERLKRDVPGGLIQLAQTSMSTEWRQDEGSSVGATKYPVDAAFHDSMRQALSGVKPEGTTSPERGESRRIADEDSVTKSLKVVELVAQSTEKWMEEPRPKKKIRRSRSVKLESIVGELVAE